MVPLLLNTFLSAVLVYGSKEICENDLKDMVNGDYKQGHEMILYSGKDVNDLGLYKNCIDLDKSKYYLMVSDVKGIPITLGLCAPDSCTEKDLKELAHQLSAYYKDSILADVFKNPEFKESSKFNDRELSPSALYFIVFLVIFAGIVGISTYLEYLNEKFPNNEQFLGREMVFVFSVISNYRKFMHVSVNKQNSQVLNGLKVLSMLLICLAHTYVYSASGPVKNLEYSVDKIRTHIKYRPVYSGIYSVDVFFLIGGFLLAYICMKQLHANAGKLNWVLFFVHRLIRIIPLYYFLNYFFIFLFPYTGFGPAWYLYHHQSNSICSDYWWSNFIFLNNFLPSSEYSCMPWSWYIACDIQFYLISPILLLIQYHKPLYGYILCTSLILGNFICIIIQGSINNYVPGASGGLMNKEQFTNLYIKPYDRIGAYILGMMLGYLLQDIERHKKEVKIEKDIELGSINTEETHVMPLLKRETERFEDKIVRLVKVFKYRMAFMGCGIFLIVFMILVPFNYDQHGGDYWPKYLRVLFLALEHIGFSFGLGLFLIPMLLGFGGMMKQFLACEFFEIASKLSLGFYLIHPIFVLYITMNTSIGIYFENVYALFLLCGVILLTSITAFILNLTIESPISRLESHLLRHLRS